MSKGKYSPSVYGRKDEDFTYNCYGEKPVLWTAEMSYAGLPFDNKLMFDGFDSEGFDSYGYSAFDSDGNYCGIGSGIDRYGYTEMDYLSDLDDRIGFDYLDSSDMLTQFPRKRY